MVTLPVGERFLCPITPMCKKSYETPVERVAKIEDVVSRNERLILTPATGVHCTEELDVHELAMLAVPDARTFTE